MTAFTSYSPDSEGTDPDDPPTSVIVEATESGMHTEPDYVGLVLIDTKCRPDGPPHCPVRLTVVDALNLSTAILEAVDEVYEIPTPTLRQVQELLRALDKVDEAGSSLRAGLIRNLSSAIERLS